MIQTCSKKETNKEKSFSSPSKYFIAHLIVKQEDHPDQG